MRLNKNTALTLTHLINGETTAGRISQQMPQIHLRSIQRALVRLSDLKLIDRQGVNNPRYKLNYFQLIKQPIRADLLQNETRPKSFFNFELLNWLLKNPEADLAQIIFGKKITNLKHQTVSDREYQHLTVEFAWKSSKMEGNTYNLLETELLLNKGLVAERKTNFETQMILNHQQAMLFAIDYPQLFKKEIDMATVEEIHRRLTDNLGIQAGLRKRVVQITASNYRPLDVPSQLKEELGRILLIINQQIDPFNKALIAFSFIPYLQPFEDGNKRVGRTLANAILINSFGQGISLKETNAKQLALAYLAFYEFNSLKDLANILKSELRSK